MFVFRIRHVLGLWFGCGPGVAGALIRLVGFWNWNWNWTMRLTLLLQLLRIPLEDIRPVGQSPFLACLGSQTLSMASRVLRECPHHQTSPTIGRYRASLSDSPPHHSDYRFSDYRGDIRASLTYRESIRLFDRPISLIGFVSLRRHYAGSCVLRYISAMYIHVFA
jgi:hypothetical protein